MSQMELLCCENGQSDACVLSLADMALLTDQRVLDNLIELENRTSTKVTNFNILQNEVNSEMRRILTTWMAEVCEDQCCEDVVLPLATNLLDRVLGCVRIKKTELQLLGSVCLLISSKLRQCRPLSAELLCFYTDNSITLEQLLNWEMFVLSKLGWTVSSVIPNDFLAPLIARIPNVKEMDMIRQHAQIFISLCSTELEFSLYKPSLVAVSSLCVAALGLHLKKNFVDTIQTTMQHLTCHSTEEVSKCIVQIEDLFSSSLTSVHQMTTNNMKRVGSSHPGTKSTHGLQQEDISQPETPTDVQDVHF